MDIQQLEQEIANLKNSHKRTIMTAIVVLLLIMTLLVFREFYGHRDPEVANLKTLVKLQQDSIRIGDIQKNKTIVILEAQIAVNTSRTTATESKVNHTTDMVKAITHKYDKIHNTVSTLSDDQQLQLFTEWLSTTDSL